jgi:hypothetical protein
MGDASESGVDRLQRVLEREFGDALRSIVVYTPSESRIHYLHEDIDTDAADGRLVRIEQLYHAERLSNTPLVHDPKLDRLHFSLFRFDGAVVVHLVDPGGAVVGFSLDPRTHVEVDRLPEFYESLFGNLPESLRESD